MKYLIGILILFQTSLLGAGAFLDNGVGASALGMGSAQVALSQDCYSIYWNPAGIAKLKRPTVGMMSTSVLGVVDQYFVGGGGPLFKKMGFALGWMSSGIQGFEEATVGGAKTGNTFGYQANAVFFGLGMELKKMDIGLSLKYAKESLNQNSASAFSLDLGAQMPLSDSLYAGLTAQNILQTPFRWNTSSQLEESLARKFRLGFGYQPTQKWTLAIDIESNEKAVALMEGLSYSLFKNDQSQILLRAGNHAGQWSMGLGCNFKNLGFDYAFQVAPESFMDNQHVFSLRF